MAPIDHVLHELVDLRAIARGSNVELRMWPERPERRAQMLVRIQVGSLNYPLRRGEDAVDVMRAIKRVLARSNVTCRRYEEPKP